MFSVKLESNLYVYNVVFFSFYCLNQIYFLKPWIGRTQAPRSGTSAVERGQGQRMQNSRRENLVLTVGRGARDCTEFLFVTVIFLCFFLRLTYLRDVCSEVYYCT